MQVGTLLHNRTFRNFLAVLAISSIFLFIPGTEHYTLKIKLFCAFTVFAILSIAADIFPLVVPSVLLPVSYFCFGIANMQTVYAPWTTQTLWMMFGAFVLAHALEECGIMERMAYGILRFFGASYNTLLYGIYCVGLILGIITFSGHYVLLVFLAYSICKALNYSNQRESLLILVVGGMAAMNIKIFAYCPATMLMMIGGVHTVDPTFNLTMVQQMIYTWPSLIIGASFIWVLTKIYHTHDIVFEGGRAYFREKYKSLGPMSVKEKKAAVFLAILMLWILTEPFHGFPSSIAFMALPWLFFVPGINIATQDSVNKLDWGLMFFISTCLSIGTVGSQIGVTKLITDNAGLLLNDASPSVFLYLVLTMGTLLNFILTPVALMATLPAPVATLSHSMNIDASTPLMTIMYSTDMIFMPFEAAAYLILFGFGLMSLKDFAKLHAMKVAWFFLLFGLIQLPYWHLIGAIYK